MEVSFVAFVAARGYRTLQKKSAARNFYYFLECFLSTCFRRRFYSGHFLTMVPKRLCPKVSSCCAMSVGAEENERECDLQKCRKIEI